MLTVISPAAHQRLTTVDMIKTELDLTGGADDAYLEKLIDQASEAIRTWCGRSFAIEGIRETLHLGVSNESVMLARWPVVSIDAVSIGGTVLDPALVEVEDSGILYRLDANGCLVGWQSGRAVIEYQAGYILPDALNSTLPKDIERAAISLVKAVWFSRNRDPFIRSDDVDGLGSITFLTGGFGTNSGFPADVEGLLSKHRQILVG